MHVRTHPSKPVPSSPSAASDGLEATEVPAIAVRGISKQFRRRSGRLAVAIDDLSLQVAPGELVGVVGPSGCGKTTLLRTVAGLDRPSAGEIRLGNTVVFGPKVFLPPEDRGIGMMFQSYALWPHMSVGQNVAYPLRCRRVGAREARARASEMLGLLGLAELEKESPSRLSGGQQQRVALARSLVARPPVLLFDEPLSNVDAKVRDELRLLLVRMHKELGFSGLYVTHDQDDAMQLCDRLIVLRDGQIEQQGSPEEVYLNPRSIYVAEFVGAVNRLSAQCLSQSGDSVTVDTVLGPIEAHARQSVTAGQQLAVLIRPHDLTISAEQVPAGQANSWSAVIQARMFRGSWMQYLLDVDGTALAVWSADHGLSEGATVTVSVRPDAAMVWSS